MLRNWKPRLSEPDPCRAFVGILCAHPDIYEKVRLELVSCFGAVDFETGFLRGDFSLYQNQALPFFRVVSFERPLRREELVDMRKKTLAVEQKFSDRGRALLELDPGYITAYTVVRSSVEEDFHRIYLYHGVYAETLYFYQKKLQILSHTPDLYRRKEVLDIFQDLRRIYRGVR